MDQPFLVAPNERYKRSFLEAVREFQADPYPLNPGSTSRYRNVDVDQLEADLRPHIRELEDEAAGRNLRPGLVPQTTYWLVDCEEFVGRVAVRHRLNERLLQFGGHIGYEIRPSKRRQGYGTIALRLALARARELGIGRVLVTCDSVNAPSRRIIERNGGVFENEFFYDEERPPKHRFWIAMDPER